MDQADHVLRAREALTQGQLIHLPTETVYGLAGRCDRDDTVAALFNLKGRPAHNPLIVHVAGIELAQELSHWNDVATRLAAAFWPGPLTIVLAARPEKSAPPRAQD